MRLFTDGGGTIDTEELEDPLTSLGLCYTRAEAEDMITRINSGEGDEIEFDDFCVLLQNKPSKLPPGRRRKLLALQEQQARQHRAEAAMKQKSLQRSSGAPGDSAGRSAGVEGDKDGAVSASGDAGIMQQLLQSLKGNKDTPLALATMLATQRRALVMKGLTSYETLLPSPRSSRARLTVTALQALATRQREAEREEREAAAAAAQEQQARLTRVLGNQRRSSVKGRGGAAVAAAVAPATAPAPASTAGDSAGSGAVTGAESPTADDVEGSPDCDVVGSQAAAVPPRRLSSSDRDRLTKRLVTHRRHTDRRRASGGVVVQQHKQRQQPTAPGTWTSQAGSLCSPEAAPESAAETRPPAVFTTALPPSPSKRMAPAFANEDGDARSPLSVDQALLFPGGSAIDASAVLSSSRKLNTPKPLSHLAATAPAAARRKGWSSPTSPMRWERWDVRDTAAWSTSLSVAPHGPAAASATPQPRSRAPATALAKTTTAGGRHTRRPRLQSAPIRRRTPAPTGQSSRRAATPAAGSRRRSGKPTKPVVVETWVTPRNSSVPVLVTVPLGASARGPPKKCSSGAAERPATANSAGVPGRRSATETPRLMTPSLRRSNSRSKPTLRAQPSMESLNPEASMRRRQVAAAELSAYRLSPAQTSRQELYLATLKPPVFASDVQDSPAASPVVKAAVGAYKGKWGYSMRNLHGE